MIKKLKHIISFLLNIGVKPELSENLADKIRIINRATLIALLIDITSLFLTKFIYQPTDAISANRLIFVVIFIEIMILVFNHFFNPKFVFYYAILVLTSVFAFLKAFFISSWGEQFIFLSIIYFVFLLFDERKEQFRLVSIITLFYITADVIHQSLPQEKIGLLFETTDSRVYLFVIYVVVLTSLINLFHKRTLKASEEQQNLLQKLQQQNEKIQRVSKEVERFNFIASHDLKSPLRNIISFIGLTKIKLKRKQYEEIPEQLDFIENATEQMNALIDDILVFSKINDAKINEATINLNDLMYDITLELNAFLQENNGQIVFNNLPTIRANYKVLKMVFLNFIKNGILYNESNHPTVNITYTLDNQQHTFQFKDNGIGIQEEYQNQVFEYFKRLHTYQAYKGTGLGLGISKKIIEKMNGSLSLCSEEGKGSVFTIQLPFIPVKEKQQVKAHISHVH